MLCRDKIKFDCKDFLVQPQLIRFVLLHQDLFISLYLAFIMTLFRQQRGHFDLVQVTAAVVITSCGCESFLNTMVSCACHVVLSHYPPGEETCRPGFDRQA